MFGRQEEERSTEYCIYYSAYKKYSSTFEVFIFYYFLYNIDLCKIQELNTNSY